MNYSDDDIDGAVAAGVLDAAAAGALRAHVAAARQLPAADEERFRLVTGFNDIFVTLAGLLLLGALSGIGAAWLPWFGALLAAAGAWGLAEFFVRRRRMALPAIVLLLAFVGSVFAAVLAAALPAGSTGASVVIWAAAAAAAAAWLHWLRFRVPITVAAGTGAAVAAAIALWLRLRSDSDHAWPMFACGLLVFALAMRWDASDRERLTRRADVAFWLHLLAAPLLVHPVFTALGGWGVAEDAWRPLVILALYVGLALVSLWIDRRALMVSALGYVLYAFSSLLQHSGIVTLGFAITALVVGCALLLLSAFWQRSRAATLPWLPEALRRRVPALR